MKHLNHIIVLLICSIVIACASIGSPDGGPYDETPPRMVSSTPTERATKNDVKKVVLEFDEFIKLENASEKVIISPPQLEQPEIKVAGKKIQIELQDSLKANTTYTIDFSDAVVDNNEGNPMGNFAFTFSTGEKIDTLEVSGTVLNAEDLEPVKGILVGLYTEHEDTAFTKLPMERIARTNGSGRFVIKGVAADTEYRVYALKDVNQNFMFDQKSEMIAYQRQLITPSFKPDIRMDTIWADSVHYDSIVPVRYTHFFPDDIVLRAFTEEMTDRYMVKNERPEPNIFNLFFSSKSDTLPKLRGLNFNEEDAFVIQANERKDTLRYWIKDSTLIKMDTLNIELAYYATDTLGNLAVQTDTLYLSSKQSLKKILQERQKKHEEWQKEQDKKKKKGEPYDSIPPVAPLDMTINSSNINPDSWVTFKFSQPLSSVDTAAVHLFHKEDTLWTEVPHQFELVPHKQFDYRLIGEWRYGEEYEIRLDSAMFQGIYGAVTNAQKAQVKIPKEEDYCALYLKVKGVEGPAFVQLLNGDKPVKQSDVQADGNTEFYYLKPGKYYLRLVKDTNGDGKWTTGKYDEDLQAEEVFYYPSAITLKERFDISQDWDINATPIEKQKPQEIVKQKPDKEKSVKSRNKERERKLKQ